MDRQASNEEPPAWSIVLASREVWPFVKGGGIGRSVWTAARILAPHAEVTVLTSARWRDEHDELRRAGDERLPAGVRFAFAEEPTGDLSPYVSWHHAWSDELLTEVTRLYPDGGPDILEVADYGGEGFAAAHARRGQDTRLRRTTLALRLQTSSELVTILNEQPPDLHLRVLFGIERFPLRFADALLWPGGDALERYAQHYGADQLAPALRCPLPVTTDMLPAPPAMDSLPDGPLRLLYLNRLERRKGIDDLIVAVRSLPDAELRLTVVGRDTDTAPGGGSMKEHARRLAAGDPRIEFVDQVPHERVPELISAHDVVVVPTRWETFSYVTREALACNRPVLATPAGAIVDVVRAGESGWLARSSKPQDMSEALRQVLASRDELETMIAARRPRAAFEASAEPESQLEVYDELVRRGRERAAVRGPEPGRRVGAVVTTQIGGAAPASTLDSLARQKDAAVSPPVLVLPPGAPPPRSTVARAGRIVLGGDGRLPQSWASGLRAVSEDLVVLVPAGALLAPEFVARAVAVLDADPALGYVTAYVDNGGVAPLGNLALPLDEVGSPASVAVVRRDALAGVLSEATAPPEDEAAVYTRLAERGAVGVVLREPFVRRLPPS
jgi:glycogen synthase